MAVGRGSITAKGSTFAILATVLTRLLGRPVVDETLLPGKYDFKLHYDQNSVGLPFNGVPFGGRERIPRLDPRQPSHRFSLQYKNNSDLS